MGGFTGPEGPREGTERDSIATTAAEEGIEAESTAPVGVSAETFPDFIPTFRVQVEKEALREGALAESTKTKVPKEETMALLEGTFPLFTRPVATRMPSVAISYPSPI